MSYLDDEELEDLPRRPPPGVLRFTLQQIIAGIALVTPVIFTVVVAWLDLKNSDAIQSRELEDLKKKAVVFEQHIQDDRVDTVTEKNQIDGRINEIGNEVLNNNRATRREIQELEQRIEELEKRKR